MFLETIEFDLADREITDARVGDDVFSGAAVDWGALMKADLHWVFEQLEAIVEAWVGDDDDPDQDLACGWLIVGNPDPDANDDARYTLHRDETGWEAQAPFADLTNDRQARISTAVLEILDAVNGLLLIYE